MNFSFLIAFSVMTHFLVHATAMRYVLLCMESNNLTDLPVHSEWGQPVESGQGTLCDEGDAITPCSLPLFHAIWWDPWTLQYPHRYTELSRTVQYTPVSNARQDCLVVIWHLFFKMRKLLWQKLVSNFTVIETYCIYYHNFYEIFLVNSKHYA